jgi:hypothetical protein
MKELFLIQETNQGLGKFHIRMAVSTKGILLKGSNMVKASKDTVMAASMRVSGKTTSNMVKENGQTLMALLLLHSTVLEGSTEKVSTPIHLENHLTAFTIMIWKISLKGVLQGAGTAHGLICSYLCVYLFQYSSVFILNRKFL